MNVAKRRHMSLVLWIVVAWLGASAQAELQLPLVFSDHMVLQRDQAAPVWGWANAGQQVTVRLAGQMHTTTADAAGCWRIAISPLSAGGPHRLEIAAGDEHRAFEDVLVGDVWLCSGQSNMDMRLRSVNDADAQIAAATHDRIRLLYVQRQLADQPMDHCSGTWTPCTPDAAREFSAAAYFFGRELQRELYVPIGLIHSAYGGTPAEGWTSDTALAAVHDLAPIATRYNDRLQRAASGGTAPPERYRPGALFNGMIYPLIPFTIRGVTWYQGESNTWRAQQYRTLLPTLISDWRSRWNDPDMPFGIVQLPNYCPPPRVPPASDMSWPLLREAQLHTATDDPHVGVIVTIDIGDALDIHPRNKQEVGRRLALWALANVYGRDIVHSGPIYRSMTIDGNHIVMLFDHVGSGLATRDGQPARGIAIAAADGKFRWASNVQLQHDRIIVSDQKIDRPAAIRYAWDANPDWANLTNREGLPASPFRTDDWSDAPAAAASE